MYLCRYLCVTVQNFRRKYSVLGLPARASALVSPILSRTETADCIMASLPGGPVLWQRPGTVQQQQGPTNLKSSHWDGPHAPELRPGCVWLGKVACTMACLSGGPVLWPRSGTVQQQRPSGGRPTSSLYPDYTRHGYIYIDIYIQTLIYILIYIQTWIS